MSLDRVAAYLIRFASWFGAIVLSVMTSSSIKEDWNDFVYVINAAFILFGGVWIGDKLVDQLAKYLESNRRRSID